MRGSGVRVPPPAPDRIKSLKTLAQSVAIGTAVTLALFGLGYVAAEMGAYTLSFKLYWQAWVLDTLSCSVSIRPGEFLCENMTAARIMFWSGIPIGILVYSAAAGLALWVVRRVRASNAPRDLR
jgi:hypothetical protein